MLGVTTVIVETEFTGLPEYFLLGVRKIVCRLYSEADFEITIPDHVPIIQADPTSDDCNDERDGANWSSRMSFN